MTTAARFHWASFAIALALFALAWGASDAVAASPPVEGAAQTVAISLDLGEVGPLASAGPSKGLCSTALPPREGETLDSAREIQLAGPVRRTSRRTSRRVSRRR